MSTEMWVLVGAVIVLMAIWDVPRRRKRVDALEEVAIAAGWSEIRRSLIGTSVAGIWNGRAVRIALHSNDDRYYLRTWVNSETGVHINIGGDGAASWSGVLEILGLVRTFPRIGLREIGHSKLS